MRILILGGTGLISTGITRELLRMGAELTLFNRGQTEALFPDGATRLTGDRKDYARFERQISDAGPLDCVIDMICYLPEDAKSLARACAHRTEQVVFCSTVEIYTKPGDRYPTHEDDGRLAVNDYGRRKAECEDILRDAEARGDFALTIVRPAYTYGEGGSLLSFMSAGLYVDRIAKKKPIVVPGDGNCLWSACHRNDVGRAFAHTAGNQKALGNTYNVTGHEWMTWNEYHQGVAEAMASETGVSGVDLVHIPTELLTRIAPDRPRQSSWIFGYNYIFDNSRAIADLDFRYTISWVEGARRTIDWLREHGRLESSDEITFEDEVVDAWRRCGDAMVREFDGAASR